MEIRVAIDESGGIEPLVRYEDFSFLASPNQPYCSSGALAIDVAKMDEFDSRWRTLRQTIQSILGLSYEPSIHMKYMWGKSLDPKMEGSANPYVGVAPEQIFAWVNQALSIIHDFNVRNRLWFLFVAHDRRTAYEAFMRYYDLPAARHEVNFFKKNYGKAYRAYHNVATSPLLVTLGELLHDVNQLGTKKQATSWVLLDSAQEYTGFDSLNAVRTLQSQGKINSIISIQTLLEADLRYADSALMQACDLLLFLYNKRQNQDATAQSMLKLYSWRDPIPSPSSFKLLRQKDASSRLKWFLDINLIRYELARAAAVRRSGRISAHMKSLEEFAQECKTQQQSLHLHEPEYFSGVPILING